MEAHRNIDRFSTGEHRIAMVHTLMDWLVKVTAENERAAYEQCAKVNERCDSHTILPLVAA